MWDNREWIQSSLCANYVILVIIQPWTSSLLVTGLKMLSHINMKTGVVWLKWLTDLLFGCFNRKMAYIYKSPALSWLDQWTKQWHCTIIVYFIYLFLGWYNAFFLPNEILSIMVKNLDLGFIILKKIAPTDFYLL